MEQPRALTEEERDIIMAAYMKNVNTLHRIAERYFKTRFDAEECVSRTFELAIINIDKFTASENKAGWLILTCRHTALEMLRREKKQRTVSLEDVNESPAPEPSAGDIDDPEGRLRVIEEIGAHLSKKNREFFRTVMITHRGAADAELSAALGISEAAVRSKRKRLADEIKTLPADIREKFTII